MTRLKHKREKLGRLTKTEVSGPRTTKLEEVTQWKSKPSWPSVEEREKTVALWPLEKCEAMVREIKRKRGLNERAWPAVTKETYEVLMRRITLLKTLRECCGGA